MSNSTSEKELNRLYKLYNRKYWKGKLPKYKVKVTSDFKKLQFGVARTSLKPKIIYFDPTYFQSRLNKKVLLHEMVHVATNNLKHGQIVRREAKRVKAPVRISQFG